MRISGTCGFGCFMPEEEQPHLGQAGPQLVDRAEQRERIEPVVDAAAPEDDLVVGADAGHDAPQHVARVHAARSSLTPNGHDAEQVVEALVRRRR